MMDTPRDVLRNKQLRVISYYLEGGLFGPKVESSARCRPCSQCHQCSFFVVFCFPLAANSVCCLPFIVDASQHYSVNLCRRRISRRDHTRNLFSVHSTFSFLPRAVLALLFILLRERCVQAAPFPRRYGSRTPFVYSQNNRLILCHTV